MTPAPPDDLVATTTDEIKNGFIWDPWIQDIQPWTRNVVRVGGCTGTLLDYEWVLSAGHCFDSTDPTGVTVRHTLEDGTVETSGAVEVLFHPMSGHNAGTETNNVDAALVRLERPMHPGIATLPLVGGTTAQLIGQTVFCAGYGAIATHGACTTSAECDAGDFCQWGVCMTPSGGTLRAANFSIIPDPVNSSTWYRFDVPNANGQLELPGDSGSSCWNGSGLTGVMKAGNPTNYNRQTAAPAFRSWAQSHVTPQLIAEHNRAAALCKPTGNTEVTYGTTGDLKNAATTTVRVACPIDRPISPTAADFVRGPRVWVYDRHPTQNVCCHLESKNPSGALVAGDAVCSSGSEAGYETLVLPSVRDTTTFSQFHLSCTIPGTSSGLQSGLDGYRAQLANR